jgi:hypothetical protein
MAKKDKKSWTVEHFSQMAPQRWTRTHQPADMSGALCGLLGPFVLGKCEDSR